MFFSQRYLVDLKCAEHLPVNHSTRFLLAVLACNKIYLGIDKALPQKLKYGLSEFLFRPKYLNQLLVEFVLMFSTFFFPLNNKTNRRTFFLPVEHHAMRVI